jgi:hypothetical protein
MMQKRLREDGIGITCQLTEMKKVRFRNLTEQFHITDMSYNYQVLLGFWGRTTFPLYSYNRTYWNKYDAPEAPHPAIADFILDYDTINLSFPDGAGLVTIGVPGWTVQPTELTTYHIEWTITEWKYSYGDSHFKSGWCTVDPSTGLVRVPYQYATTKEFDQVWVCDVAAAIYNDGAASPFISRQLAIRCHFPASAGVVTDPISLSQQKHTIKFDEQIKLGVWIAGEHPFQRNFCGVAYWEIPLESRKYLRFPEPTWPDGTCVGDGRSVTIQARQQATNGAAAEVIAHYVNVDGSLPQQGVFDIEVVSDQIQMTDWSIEAPYVGNSMSTPQLYLTSNCGNQWFNNDLERPHDLDAVMVAVIHNSFTVGYPISGAGDAPVLVTGCDLSHLEYELVDSNYYPIRLESPMFLTLKVEAAENPIRDVSVWRGKLPKDAPTPQQKAEMERQQAEAQQKQTAQKQRMDGLTDLLQRALTRVAEEPPPPPPAEEQEPEEILLTE